MMLPNVTIDHLLYLMYPRRGVDFWMAVKWRALNHTLT